MTSEGSSLSPDDYDDDYAGEPITDPDYSSPPCSCGHRTRSNQAKHFTLHTNSPSLSKPCNTSQGEEQMAAHYIASIRITKVERRDPPLPGRSPNPTPARSKSTLANITVGSDSLETLVNKTSQHLALVDDSSIDEDEI